MKYKNPVIITGPTTTGKTDIALAAAKKFDGEIINSDILYTYSFLKIGTGLCDNLKNTQIPKHLYCILEPHDTLTPEEYTAKVEKLIPQIISRSKLPIIEGCSSKYNPALIKKNMQPDRTFTYTPLIGIKWPDNADILAKIENRFNKMLEEGLLAEAEEIYKKGLGNTYPVQISVVYEPLMKYFENKTTINTAKEKIIKKWIEVYHAQLETFQKIPEIKWIESSNQKQTLEQALELIEKNLLIS